MNFYLTAIEGMPKLLDCCDGDVMQYFQKKNYADSFQKIYQAHVPTLDAIENGYNLVIDKEQFLTNMAEALAKHAAEKVNACTRRSRKEKLEMDLNLTMAVFVLPMVLEYRGESSKRLSEKLIEAWKQEFPKTSLQAANHTTIEEGFHKKWCYITTAVCQTFGKPDDCYELSLLREYRDTYLMESPQGSALIDRYYDVAPSIVKHIDQQADSAKIYQEIWEEWLAPCISMIENGQLGDCREHYIRMVYELQDKYFNKEIIQ